MPRISPGVYRVTALDRAGPADFVRAADFAVGFFGARFGAAALVAFARFADVRFFIRRNLPEDRRNRQSVDSLRARAYSSATWL